MASTNARKSFNLPSEIICIINYHRFFGCCAFAGDYTVQLLLLYSSMMKNFNDEKMHLIKKLFQNNRPLKKWKKIYLKLLYVGAFLTMVSSYF
jgi:hypothetical protein